MLMKNKEQKRLEERKDDPVFHWEKWGPYVSERSWGTVREDYSATGEAWSYFPYDLAHSKAYRWGEDAIAGWCDRYQVLVLAPVFWNGKDSILKERLFGLSSLQGNHGEDVKEYYYHLDGTPTHSYMRYLYKYPHEAFPYEKLKEENSKRSTADSEYELIDTGVFENDRYFDIFIDYAKASPEDLCMRIEIHNKADKEATLHVLPHLWFRNQWAFTDVRQKEPKIVKTENGLLADEGEMPSPSNLSFPYRLGTRYLYGPQGSTALFTDNDTGSKDAFHKEIAQGIPNKNPRNVGTKACLHYTLSIPAHGTQTLLFRFTNTAMKDPLKDVEEVIQNRKAEADAFYESIHPKTASAEEKKIQRQAFAEILWNKQIYLYDVNLWLKGDNSAFPPPHERYHIRNGHWRHLNSMRILAMPDKWEYPYFCAWDQAFHCLTYALIDMASAKEQLWLLLFDQFQHPNGQIPACEWEFSDLNPPVQSLVALEIFELEKKLHGKEDREFLERCFHKLLMNFAWWVNKVDSSGNNVFEGGFLGLDNITVLDRSQKLPGGVTLQQSDGTGWMAMFCLNLMRISLILAQKDEVYESLATKFFEHYVYIAHAMKKRGDQDYEMWSEKDRFFYDVLTYPGGAFAKFRVRSLVGIIPLYAVDFLTEEELNAHPEFAKNFFWFLENRKDFVSSCIIPVPKKKKYVLALMTENQLKSVLEYVWNPAEFRAEYGLRSLSKFHEHSPFVFEGRSVGYEPAESLHKVKGGNSNWRGPVWIPTTFLLIDSLRKFADAFEDEMRIEIPQESSVNLHDIAHSFAYRILSIFQKNASGNRPYLAHTFQNHAEWQEHLLFYEYYHPETGQGLGASHQGGWSALVANLIDFLHNCSHCKTKKGNS